MNMRHQILTLCFVLPVVLLFGSCSNDEPGDSTAATGQEATEQAQAETAATDSSSPEEDLPPAAPSEREFPGTEVSESNINLPNRYKQECKAGEQLSRDCEIMRSLLVVDAIMALEDIQRSRDQRGTEQALKALDLSWEPEILIAACRVLGYFPDTPGIAEKAVPLLLDSPYLAVAQAAAQLLGQNPDPALASMAQQWSSNHGVLWTDDPYLPAPDFPEHYFDMGFPEYPDAEWFSPADSDRSVGWRVAATPAEVSAWLAEELGVAAMGYDQWAQRLSEEMMKAYQVVMDPAYTAELQKLMEQYMKSQDPAIMEEIEKKQQEMDAVSKKIESDAAKRLNNVLSPPGGVVMEDLSWFVAEEKQGHVARAVMVYQYAGSDRTVMQMAWDLRDYPPAWPVAD
jgi:hypothetical protein